MDKNEQVSGHAGNVVDVGQHLEPAAAGKDFSLNQGKALRIGLFHLKSPKAFPKVNSGTHSLTQARVERQKAEENKGKYKEYFELTPGVQSGDGDLDNAGQLKNKCRKLRPAAWRASQEHGLGYCNASCFPELWQPRASLPQLVHPCGTGRMEAQGSPGYLSSCCRAQPQRFQVLWGWGWPLAVQFSRSSWPLLKRWGLGSTFTQGASAGFGAGLSPWVPFTRPAKYPPGRVPQRSKDEEPTLDEEPQGGGGSAMGALCHTLVQAPVPWLHGADLQRMVLQQPGPAIPWLCCPPIPAPGQVVGHIPQNHAGHDHVLAR